MRFSAVGRGRWGVGAPWAWPGAAGGPSWPSLSPLQPWSCSSWCGWSGGRRSGTPSSCSSTPRTTSGTTSSSMMKREEERRIRWGETLSCGQGAAGQSVLSKKGRNHIIFSKTHAKGCVLLFMTRQLYRLPWCHGGTAGPGHSGYYWDTLLCKQDNARRPVPQGFFYPQAPSWRRTTNHSIDTHVQTVFRLFKSLKLCVLREIF